MKAKVITILSFFILFAAVFQAEATQAEKRNALDKEVIQREEPLTSRIGEDVEIKGVLKEPCPANMDSKSWRMVIPIYRLRDEGLDGREDLCGMIYQKQDGTNIICLEKLSFQVFVLKNVADRGIVLKGRFTQMVDQGRPISESSLVLLADSIKPSMH